MIYNARSSLGAIALAPLVSAAVLDLPITFRNTYAIVDVAIGTPAKTHSLMFDTGSATAWIVDAECAEDCNNDSGWSRDGYNRNESSSSSELGTYAEISYLGGVTSGPGVADTFSLGDAKWSQSFMDANESSWTVLPADGFLGLAFSTITDAGTKTMVETMMQAHLLDEPRFSIYYGTELNDTGNAAGKGVLTIGGSEEEKYVDGDLTWVPLQRINGEYEVWRSTLRILTGSEGISGNGSSTDTQFYPDDAWGVFDSGAGTITVPPLQVDALYQSIGMNYTAILNGDHIPLCTEFNSSWSVSFTFGDDDASASTVTITGDQLARPGFAYRDDACNPPFDGGHTDGFFLFGTALLNQFYTVFDFGAENVEDYEPRVGFGQLKEEYAPWVPRLQLSWPIHT